MQTNARLAVVVACVSVTAVAVGGAVAYRQVPSPASSAATPLTDVVTSSSPVSKTPSSTPSVPLTTPKPVPTPTPSLTPPPKPTPTPTPGSTGPVKVSVDLAKLGKGRAPQIPYLVGRVVRGGAGPDRTIPGTDTIGQIVRSSTEVLAVVSDFTRSRLVRLGVAGTATYTADVTSLVGGGSGDVAYAAVPDGSDGSGGGTVYYERAGSQRKLDVPATAFGLEVLGLQNGNKVYYRWQSTIGGPWKLFEWLPGSTPQQVKTVVSADYVSADGVVAGSISDSAPAEGGQTCSTVTLLATGKRLWRTCDSWVQGFTPDHSITLGTGGRGDEGTAATVTAQDTATGRVLREWAGAFEVVAAEDDQHVLIVARSGIGGVKGSIIRCDVGTGGCEFAVGLTSGYMSLSGLGR